MALTKVQPEMMQQLTASIMPTGSVIQTVQGVSTTSLGTTSTSFVTTGLSVSITPIATTSKVLVTATFIGSPSTSTVYGFFTLYRGSTNLAVNSATPYFSDVSYLNNYDGTVTVTYLDSPATTSSTTYTIYFKSSNGAIVYIGDGNSTSTITAMEIHG